VNPEHTRRSPAVTTGRFAVLFASLRGGGSGAPSSGWVGGRTPSLRLAALTVVAAAAFMAFGANSALAAETHVLTNSFGAAQLDLQAGNLTQDASARAGSGLAVNQTSHDVYVADTGNGRVARFEADGTFVGAFGSLTEPTFIAIDNSGSSSAGDVYVADSAAGSVSKFAADGTPVAAWGTAGVLTGFPEMKGIAVGPGGDLFILNENETLHRYESDGTQVGSPLPTPRGTVPAGIAADAEGNLYKVAGIPQVTKFGPAGENLAETLDAREDAVALGVDPSNNDLYVAQSNGGTPFVNRFEVNCELSEGPPCTPLESFGSGEVLSPQGIAIDVTSHLVYLTDAAASRVDVFKLANVPTVTATSVSENTGLSVVVHSEVNPDGVEVTGCAFEYVTQAAFDQTGFADLSSGGSASCEEPEASEIGAGTEPVAVHAKLEGLTPNTAYRYRLAAANAEGTHRSQSLPFITSGPPSIDSTSASEVSATTALLETELNPHGLLTTYRFEYDTVSYSEGEGPHGESTPTGSAGSGTVDVARTAPLSGLQPATTYHFRVVAVNALGTSEGPDRSFTTQPASASTLLPDDRAYELVSPPDKHGAPLEAIRLGDIQAAADGSAIAYVATGPIEETAAGSRSAAYSELLSRRQGPGAWATEDIATPHQAPAGSEPGNASEYKLFSTDLSRAALQPTGSTPLSPLATNTTPYRREADGSFTPLVYPGNVPPGTHFGETSSNGSDINRVHFITATPDLGHLLLGTRASLVPGFENAGQEAIYEWAEGTLAPVSLIPPSGQSVCGGTGPACLPSGAEGAATPGNRDSQVRGAISTDGSRAVFATDAHRLYLRDLARGETLRLDAAQGLAEPEVAAATFQLASADGRQVFFTDPERLTPDSTAASQKPDLYMCQIKEESGHLACALTDLTANTLNLAEPAAVQGAVIGAAEDGSSVYFVAQGALTEGEGAVPGDCKVLLGVGSGQCNLYHYDTATQETQLVAVLSGADFPDWQAGGGFDLGEITARVSPNGRWLAFMSSRPLTGYDNRDVSSGARDQEVFLYDSQAPASEALHCASCNPSGSRPHGAFDPGGFPGPLVDRNASNWGGQTLAANIPGWTRVELTTALNQSRYLSDSGRLFFNAADALAPQDTNGTFDVYEYEPPQGPGQPASNSCTPSSATYSPASGGCVSLISSGTSPHESAFLDASESGDDVFFLTASHLSPRDLDGALDLYDARVGGGEPGVVKPVECSGDACQQPAVPPNDPTPGSLTFNGTGNLLQCPKGKVKRSGKCVARKHKKAKKKNKSHKKHQRSKRTASHNRRGGK
jgi:DNA-binding beta-propeller fold protein YncE